MSDEDDERSERGPGQELISAGEKVAEGIREILPENEDTEGARTALEVAQGTMHTVNAAADTVQALARGDAAGVIGGLGEAAGGVRHLVPEGEARRILEGAGRVASGVRQGVQAVQAASRALGRSGTGRHGREVSEALDGAALGSEDVEFDLHIEGVSGRWGVRDVQLEEGLSTMPLCLVHALVADATPNVVDLLYSNAQLRIGRSVQQRYVKGIVQHARVHDTAAGLEVELRIVPALWLLSQIVRSHIHQAQTATEIVEEVFRTYLQELQRTVRLQVDPGYEIREYTTQYQESVYAFLCRLLEEEGIFWYFDYESEEHEVLVLCDANTGLPWARQADRGSVPYAEDPHQAPDHEAVRDVAHFQEIGATDTAVTDYDWTHPDLVVRGVSAGNEPNPPALEVHDHTDAVTFHRYGGGAYAHNTAEVQARLRAQRLQLARQSWSMHSTVVTALPGHVLDVHGCPDGDLDQPYIVVHASSRGLSTEGREGTWESALRCVPVSRPFRPARRTRRPVVSGPETAFVVGPAGEEIHTDEHGRVRVRFHWDRQHPRGAEASSCWMRVAHNWAGPGFGTFFLPRIGMEVVVSFLGGNPDRPLVTGCVYNGTNTARVNLPEDKTQSYIRTKSSLHSDGFNELRFEDKAGREEIYVHAQRNLREVVEHDHDTHVKNGSPAELVGHLGIGRGGQSPPSLSMARAMRGW
ncbi:MAG: type VI secretion system tip protein VgrG [Sandaracinaceae bacterium]|nr:type VI secretion system tip protein VgrG [Sandaracinaceae bacterium]